MKITWFGHSAFRVEFGEAVILIDPFLSGNPTFEGDLSDASRGCTHVLLTHGHDDHIGDAASICGATGAQLVSSFEVCMFLAAQGAEKVNPGNHGGTVDCGPFTVSFVNALHSSSTIKDGRPIYLGNPMGLIVKAPGQPTLYHMGDTEIFGDMALIEEIHRPEIGIVPIGDRFTMGARTAAMACRRFFNFRHVVPAHYATFPMLDQSADRFLAEMGDHASRVIVPERLTPFEV
ncbi:metal-dependent hydrolase [Faunimonas sp. B44]|uniref:metal-dependent hydrolase n=1 Tax=Faunimonas sp. B44 TaxID=3461493 RepID=UPI004044110D